MIICKSLKWEGTDSPCYISLMDGHTNPGSGASTQMWEMAHCCGSLKIKAPAILWTLWGEREGGELGVEKYREKSEWNKVFSRCPPLPLKRRTQQKYEGFCPRPQIETQKWKHQARNANIWKAWLGRGVWAVACNCLQRLQCIGYVPSLGGGQQPFSYEACQVKPL